jgi:hypothetical protein
MQCNIRNPVGISETVKGFHLRVEYNHLTVSSKYDFLPDAIIMIYGDPVWHEEKISSP